LFIGVAVCIAWSLPDRAGSAETESDMVYIPAGEFLMGSRSTDGKIGFEIAVDELPQRKVNLGGYYIDRFEVTVAQYKKFLSVSDRTPPSDPRFPEVYPWGEGEEPPAELMNHPVIYVNWFDATDFCRWDGKRLPTEAEWEKAGRGTDGRFWPWGNKFDPKKANVREYGARGTLPVGSFPEGVSPYGVYDMAGNAAEWVDNWYQAYPGSTLVREAFGEVNKVIRGGAWTLFGDPYSRVTHRTRAMDPHKRHRSIGFRCAKDGN
jgi:formylglycine-generating enzyme required for sulfatase activity